MEFLDPEKLEQWARAAKWRKVLDALGGGAGLAPWLMPRTELDRLGVPRPLPRAKPGSAIVLFARDPAYNSIWLGEGFALPLLWQRTASVADREDTEAKLPAALVSVAQCVRRSLSCSDTVWGLTVDPDFGSWDLSGFNLSADSAFAALAGGLICATSGGSQKNHVFATGAWTDDQGIAQVSGLVAKQIALACIDVATPLLFVPLANEAEPAKHGVRIKALVGATASDKQKQPDVRKQLANLLEELEVPPTAENLSVAESFANRPDRIHWAGREEYFEKTLLPAYIADAEVRAPVQDLVGCAAVVIANDGNRPTCHLLLKTLEPQAILVVYQDEVGATKNRDLATMLTKGARNGTPLASSGSWEELTAQVRLWLASQQSLGRRLVVDCFGGLKEQTAALVAAAVLEGGVGVTLDKSFSGRNVEFAKPKLKVLNIAAANTGPVVRPAASCSETC